MSTIWSVAEGFASGSVLADMKRTEDSVRQGQNHYLTAVHQSGQIWECLSQVQRVLEAASYATLSFSTRCIFALPPVLLAYAAAHQWGGQSLYLIYDQIGTLCQVASLVSSVTLIIFGNVAFGVASITFIGLGFLDRNGILPQGVRGRARTAGLFTPSASALYSFSIIGFGVPAGASRASQPNVS